MKQTKVLKEKNEYKNRERIFTATTETTTSLSEDMATLANYQATLANYQATIERMLETMPTDEIQQQAYGNEIKRIEADMNVLRRAIEIQNGYIKGFDENAL